MRALLWLCVSITSVCGQYFPLVPITPFGNSPLLLQALLQSPRQSTTYQSDKSGAPLSFGDFYHKVGEAYDVNKREFLSLPQEEQAKFVAILSQNDLNHVLGDWQTKPLHEQPQTGVSTSPASGTSTLSQDKDLPSQLEPSTAEQPPASVDTKSEVAPQLAAPLPVTEEVEHQLASPLSNTEEALPQSVEVVPQTATENTERNGNAMTAEETLSSVAQKPTITHFYSALSEEELSYGNWFHKVGTKVDVTSKEFHSLPSAAQSAFVPITSDADFTAHFMGKETEKDKNTVRFVEGYKSDISNTQLSFGDFYHKVGESYDINSEEYNSLSPADKSKFVPINEPADLTRFSRDYEEAKHPEAVVEVPIGNGKSRQLKYHSDISHKTLAFGDFYHKVGDAYDITSDEFNSLSSSEKAKFVPINEPTDLSRYANDYKESGRAAVIQVPSGNGENRQLKYHSDISHKTLSFGDFFHKEGFAFDITREEFNALPLEERSGFVEINEPSQILNYQEDYTQGKTMKAVDVYRSNLSGKQLSFGNFFHKVGEAYDISKNEWLNLPQEDKSNYVDVTSESDLAVYADDYKDGSWVSKWHSDISDRELQYGNFYHKIGSRFDITRDEYLSLSPSSRKLFVAIDSPDDIIPYIKDWDKKNVKEPIVAQPTASHNPDSLSQSQQPQPAETAQQSSTQSQNLVPATEISVDPPQNTGLSQQQPSPNEQHQFQGAQHQPTQGSHHQPSQGAQHQPSPPAPATAQGSEAQHLAKVEGKSIEASRPPQPYRPSEPLRKAMIMASSKARQKIVDDSTKKHAAPQPRKVMKLGMKALQWMK